MTGYEFTPDQDRLLLDLAGKMQAVGLFLLLVATGAVLAAGLGFREAQLGYGTLCAVLALFFALTGAWTLRSQRSLRRVAETEGRDIEYLLSALDELRKFYRLKFWLVVLCLAFLLTSIFSVPTPLH